MLAACILYRETGKWEGEREERIRGEGKEEEKRKRWREEGRGRGKGGGRKKEKSIRLYLSRFLAFSNRNNHHLRKAEDKATGQLAEALTKLEVLPGGQVGTKEKSAPLQPRAALLPA